MDHSGLFGLGFIVCLVMALGLSKIISWPFYAVGCIAWIVLSFWATNASGFCERPMHVGFTFETAAWVLCVLSRAKLLLLTTFIALACGLFGGKVRPKRLILHERPM